MRFVLDTWEYLKYHIVIGIVVYLGIRGIYWASAMCLIWRMTQLHDSVSPIPS